MSDYVEFGIWLMWAVLGFGVGRFTWRNKTVYEAPQVAPETQTVDVLMPTTATWAGDGPAPFRVVTLGGGVRYEGTEGGAARRHIEVLRKEGVEWRAYRDGSVWDWGPRE